MELVEFSKQKINKINKFKLENQLEYKLIFEIRKNFIKYPHYPHNTILISLD